tara:strand:- start:276 stop:746 length:471 start_codon:yes stop_codon:yes gene_type:complete
MSHADKVVSWSLSLNMESGETIEAVNLPSFTVAAIDDFCTELDSGKIDSESVKMKMTESGYYYKPSVGTSESQALTEYKESLGSGIGFKDLPMSTPGSFTQTTTDNAFDMDLNDVTDNDVTYLKSEQEMQEDKDKIIAKRKSVGAIFPYPTNTGSN